MTPYRQFSLLFLGLALMAGCASDESGDPAAPLTVAHPVPNGQWPPTVGDQWPSLASAIEFQGCLAYGGIPIPTIIDVPTFVDVRGASFLGADGQPYTMINPVMFNEHDQSRQFLYFHECAHHLVQDPAFIAADESFDPILAEYGANCHAASYLLRNELYSRRDIDFILLVLANNRGPDRPPFSAEELVQCLRGQGLY